MDYEICIARTKDIKEIIKIISDRCDWFSKQNLIGWRKEDYLKKYNRNYFEKQIEENKLFVAKRDDKILGVMLLKKSDLNIWEDGDKASAYYLHHLATSLGEKGLGKQLINFAIEQCKKDNIKYLRLSCYKDSIFLNNYYKSLGFKNKKGLNKRCYICNLWQYII